MAKKKKKKNRNFGFFKKILTITNIISVNNWILEDTFNR